MFLRCPQSSCLVKGTRTLNALIVPEWVCDLRATCNCAAIYNSEDPVNALLMTACVCVGVRTLCISILRALSPFVLLFTISLKFYSCCLLSIRIYKFHVFVWVRGRILKFNRIYCWLMTSDFYRVAMKQMLVYRFVNSRLVFVKS